ncbi:MAG: cytochrome c biogenesis protein CcsA [Gammaproteobacteria bacterium]|nr:cytochrome c biogenesis protein CcsA [Gammaproteobacteria bacterium]
MPYITIIPFVAYLLVALLLTRYFTQDSETHQHKTLANILLLLACVSHAYLLSDLWQTEGVFFGLASSVSFVAWVVAALLFVTSLSKPIHALGIIVYPLAAIALLFSLAFPDSNNKLIEVSIAAHVFLSISAYALLAIAVCQSVLLNIQEKLLHEHQINSFINKLPPLQTMEDFLFQTLKMGCLLLTLSLASGFIFIDDFFTQQLTAKTLLSLIAWAVFVGLVAGHKIFGWRGKYATLTTQIGFGMLVLAYFGTKFVLERLLA